jgi:hypothetical protein
MARKPHIVAQALTKLVLMAQGESDCSNDQVQHAASGRLEHERSQHEHAHGNKRDRGPAAAIARSATPAASRLLAIASTSAPAGTWAVMATVVPTLKANPISSGFQSWAVKYTERNGPNPACIAATSKFSQLSPIRLRSAETGSAVISAAPRRIGFCNGAAGTKVLMPTGRAQDTGF